MVRHGRYKYLYFHNKETQLFDLENDPDEWENLSGLPQLAVVEKELKQAILSHFDVDRIMPEIWSKLQQKIIVRTAMHHNGTHWGYQPHFDATKQYMRSSADDPYMRK